LAAKNLVPEATLANLGRGIRAYDAHLRLAALKKQYIQPLGDAAGFIQLRGKLQDHLAHCARRGHFGRGEPETGGAHPARGARAVPYPNGESTGAPTASSSCPITGPCRAAGS